MPVAPAPGARLAWVGIVLLMLTACAHALVVNTNKGSYIVGQITAAFGPQSKELSVAGVPAFAHTGLCEATLEEAKLVYNTSLSDKVVFVRRGGGENCFFYSKVLLAQQLGATAVCVGNNDNLLFRMGFPDGLARDDVTIKSVILRNTTFVGVLQLFNITEIDRPDADPLSASPTLAALATLEDTIASPAPLGVTFLPRPSVAVLSVAAGASAGAGFSVQQDEDTEVGINVVVSHEGEASTTPELVVPEIVAIFMVIIPALFCIYFMGVMMRRVCRRRILREQAVDIGRELTLAVYVPPAARILYDASLAPGAPAVVTQDTFAKLPSGALRLLSRGAPLSGDAALAASNPAASFSAQESQRSGSMSQVAAVAMNSFSGSGRVLGSPRGTETTPLQPGETAEVVLTVSVAPGTRTCGNDVGPASGAVSPSSSAAAALEAGAGAGDSDGPSRSSGSSSSQSVRAAPLPVRPPSHARLHNDSCSVCIEDFVPGVLLKPLPCGHAFHGECIDGWLARITGDSVRCPICSQSILSALEEQRWQSASCATKAYRVCCACEPCTRRVRPRGTEQQEREREVMDDV